MKAKEEFLGSLTPFYGLKVDSLVEEFPAEKIGLKPGDGITPLDEKEIKDWNALLQMVTTGQGKPMVMGGCGAASDSCQYRGAPEGRKKSAAGCIGVKFKRERKGSHLK